MNSVSTPTSTPASTAPRNRARLALVTLFAVFFLPIFASMWLNFERPGWLPFGTVNHGYLLQPPYQLDDADLEPFSFADGWTFLHLAPEGCDDSCIRALHSSRQGRIALGKDADRLQRLLLIGPRAAISNFYEEHPNLHEGKVSAAWIEALSRNSTPADPKSATSNPTDPTGALFVVDPQGYVVLRYDVSSDPAGWFKDLRRLLNISKIG